MFLVKHKATQKEFAAKIFKNELQGAKSELVDFEREVNVLNACRGVPRVIQIYESFFEDDEIPVIVTNYYNMSDLVSYAIEKEINTFSE